MKMQILQSRLSHSWILGILASLLFITQTGQFAMAEQLKPSPSEDIKKAYTNAQDEIRALWLKTLSLQTESLKAEKQALHHKWLLLSGQTGQNALAHHSQTASRQKELSLLLVEKEALQSEIQAKIIKSQTLQYSSRP